MGLEKWSSLKAVAIDLFCLFVFFPEAYCGYLIAYPSTKSWASNVNFGNAMNWEGGQIPCQRNRVIFPSLASIFLQKNAGVREIVFANDGELIFGTNVKLSLGDPVQDVSPDGCVKRDVRFQLPEAGQWYSASSWQVDGIEDETVKIPIPELYRVPCFYDNVKFPKDNSFNVVIKGPTIAVSALSLAGQDVNSTEFVRLLATRSGSLQFHKHTTLNIHNTTCTDLKGCKCDNDNVEISSLVCELTSCPKIKCKDPIRPIGSCCDICGSVLTIKFNTKFEFSKLFELFRTFINKPSYPNVNGYFSRIRDDVAQSVFEDKTESHKAAALASDIKRYLDDDINNLGLLSLVSVDLKTSKNWIHDFFTDENKGSSIGRLMGIVIAFVVIVALGVTAFGYYRKHTWVDLSFGRLLDNKQEDEEPKETQDICSFAPQSSKEMKGFDNPMYQTPSPGPLFEDTAIGTTVKTSVEERPNPVFMSFEDLEES